MCGGGGLTPPILTSAQDGGDWPTSRTRRYTPGKPPPPPAVPIGWEDGWAPEQASTPWRYHDTAGNWTPLLVSLHQLSYPGGIQLAPFKYSFNWRYGQHLRITTTFITTYKHPILALKWASMLSRIKTACLIYFITYITIRQSWSSWWNSPVKNKNISIEVSFWVLTVLNMNINFFYFSFWGYWHCGHSWPIVPASGDSEDDCGEADGM
jgi:hypothetical protein